MLTTISAAVEAVSCRTATRANAIRNKTRTLFIIHQGSEIGNQGVDSSQILPATLLGSQPPLPHHDGEIADTMQLFACQFFCRRVTVKRIGRCDQFMFESLGINARGSAQLATQLL